MNRFFGFRFFLAQPFQKFHIQIRVSFGQGKRLVRRRIVPIRQCPLILKLDTEAGQNLVSPVGPGRSYLLPVKPRHVAVVVENLPAVTVGFVPAGCPLPSRAKEVENAGAWQDAAEVVCGQVFQTKLEEEPLRAGFCEKLAGRAA